MAPKSKEADVTHRGNVYRHIVMQVMTRDSLGRPLDVRLLLEESAVDTAHAKGYVTAFVLDVALQPKPRGDA